MFIVVASDTGLVLAFPTPLSILKSYSMATMYYYFDNDDQGFGLWICQLHANVLGMTLESVCAYRQISSLWGKVIGSISWH